MENHKTTTHAAWIAARKELLAKEKDLTRQRDALNAERRNLPMVEIEKDYIFDGPNGAVRLIDMFEGRPQLIIYHFMFDPEWEDGCPSCTAGTDELSAGFFAHLHTRDTSYAMVSRAPVAKLERWRAKKGWDVPWYFSFGTDFNYDFGSRSTSRSRPASTTTAPRPGSRPWGRTSSPQTSPSRCRAGAASSKSADAFFTPTPSTPGALSPPAAPTTSSTSPRSAGKRSGRNPRDAASPHGPPRPTSRRNYPPRQSPLTEPFLPMLPAGGQG